MTSIISVKDVTKFFDLPKEKSNSLKQLLVHPLRFFSGESTRQLALSDISFEVKEGEFFGIVGKNGSGKSTLLKLLAGIYQPNVGSLEVRGSIMPFIELGVGFNAELTGRENVFLSGALLGFSQQQMQERYAAIVDFAELEDFMDQKLKNFSSGMQVRLAFSIATQVNTDIFLIDEVLAVGDTEFQRKCYDYFKKLKRDKKTVVFITHEMEAVRQYCDRAMLIHDSKVQAIGSVAEITRRYDMLNQRKALSEDTEGSPSRWGDGSGKTISVRSASEIYHDDEPVVIETDFEILQDVEDATFGIGITDQQGRPVTGSNTDLIGSRLGKLPVGTKLSLKWTIDQVFNDGEYVVSAELKHAGGVADSIASAARFGVSRSIKTGFMMVPAYDLHIDGKVVVKQRVHAKESVKKVSPAVSKQPATKTGQVVTQSSAHVAVESPAFRRPQESVQQIGEPGIINALQILDASLQRYFKKLRRHAKIKQYKPNQQTYDVTAHSAATLLAGAKQRDYADFNARKYYKRWVAVSGAIRSVESTYLALRWLGYRIGRKLKRGLSS